MRILHIFADKLGKLDVPKEHGHEFPKEKKNIFLEINIATFLDSALRSNILYDSSIDIVKFLTELLQWEYMADCLTQMGITTTILDILSFFCTDLAPSRPEQSPEIKVSYSDDSIDLSNKDDVLISQCLDFLKKHSQITRLSQHSFSIWGMRLHYSLSFELS